MSYFTNLVDPDLSRYLRDLAGRREDPVLAELREATARLPSAAMQISVEQGRLMALLVRMLGARSTLEVGVFTGYSALCVAQCLPPDGRVVACDVSKEWTDIGRPFFEKAGVADRIDLRIGPAARTLDGLIEAGEAGRFDFAFIDADKQAQDGYYEQVLVLLRPGGVLGIDNAFLAGRAFQPSDATAVAVRKLTDKIFADERVDASMVPIGDGLLLARKRE